MVRGCAHYFGRTLRNLWRIRSTPAQLLWFQHARAHQVGPKQVVLYREMLF